MRKFTIAVIAVVALMLFSGMLLAQEQKEIKMRKEIKRRDSICLDLDEAQKAQLHELKYELKLAVIDLKADLQKLKLELKYEMMKDEPAKKTVDKLVTDIGATQTKMKKLHIDLAFKAKKILKPEQWKKFIKQHMQKGRRGSGGCCSPGGHSGMHQKRMRILRGGAGCGSQCGPGYGSGCGPGRGSGKGHKCGPGRLQGHSCGPECGQGMEFLFSPGCWGEMGFGGGEHEMIWFEGGHGEEVTRHIEIIKEDSGRI